MSTYDARKKAALHSGLTYKKLLSTSALTAASAMALSSPAHADDYAWILDQIYGNFGYELTIEGAQYITTILQQSGIAIGEGNLDIAAFQSVFIQNDDGLFVARSNTGDPTQILGNLHATGRVMVIDTNGVFFSAGSTVNVGGIIVSTGDIANSDIIDGDDSFTFDNFGDGEIVLNGTINVAEAGIAAFVSPFISNSGVINAQMGTVAFAAGETVTLDLYGDGLMEVAVEGELADALLENSGGIYAEGGNVIMTAQAAKDAVDNIINMDGVISVASAHMEGGTIVLSGGDSGTVSVTGTLDASGEGGGGDISVTGQNVVIGEDATLYADAGQHGDGGNIYMYGTDSITFDGEAYARGGSESGDGGFVEVSTAGSLDFEGYVDTSAANGETGTLLIDPENLYISNALAAIISQLLLFNNVELEADNNIWVEAGSDFSMGWFFGWHLTGHDLTLTAQIVHILGDIIFGNGNFTVNADTLNLDGHILSRDTEWGDTSLMDGSRYTTTADWINVLSNNALIQQAVNFAQEHGVTIDVADGTYTENLIIDKANLTLQGNGATIQAANGGYLIDVLASNTSIYDFILNGEYLDDEAFGGGGLADYGINAVGAGADGLVVDGNTFMNFNEAGIYLSNTTGGMATISNNVFEGSATRGLVAGTLGGGFMLDILDNTIGSEGDEVLNGLLFGEINDATVNISGGSIHSGGSGGAIDGDGINFTQGLNSGADVNISDITIVSSDEAVDVHDTLHSGATFDINGGSYTGGNNGIEFAAIEGEARVSGATIHGTGAGKRGINLLGAISGLLEITDSTIIGEGDGIGSNNGQAHIDGGTFRITGSTVTGVNGDGIKLGNVLGGGVVQIMDNEEITGADNGINFTGYVDGSTVEILRNNIHAGNHGLFFAGDIMGGADIDIHDNLILANQDGGVIGNGIHFDGDIYTATINIGDGLGGEFDGDPSNFITGVDGIHFAGDIMDNAEIVIDGNRIGYGIDEDGNFYGDRVGDDGIQFAGDIYGDASISITDNWINAWDDGISFLGDIYGYATVLIGGSSDGNTIDAWDEGVQFQGDITEHSLIEISHNYIEADGHGIVFNGETSNHRAGHDEEILIAYNWVNAGQTGVLFEGLASHAQHDIMIRDNHSIRGGGDGHHGIAHTGGINDAELWILDNAAIHGQEDGIHLVGHFYNGAKIRIAGNGWDGGVRGHNDDGILVWDLGGSGGANVRIIGNHVDHSGGDGIRVHNIDGVRVRLNEVHNIGGHGIYVTDSDEARINGNTLWNIDRHGIYLDGSDYVEIRNNQIGGWIDGEERFGAGWDGIRIKGSDYADIENNDISNVGDDGIHAQNSDYVNIYNNNITHTGQHFDDGEGIQIDDGSDHVYIEMNSIMYAGDDGIDIDGGYGHYISNNYIYGSGGDGIDLDGGEGITVEGNTIEFSEEDGIDADYIYGLDILNNWIAWSGNNGVSVHGGAFSYIYGNGIEFSANHGILAHETYNLWIDGNDIYAAGNDGIHVGWVGDYGDYYGEYNTYYSDGFAVKVTENNVNMVGDDGVEVHDSAATLIGGNTIADVGLQGWLDEIYYEGNGYGGYYSFYFYGGDEYGADGIHARNIYSDGYNGDYAYAYGGDDFNPNGYSLLILDNLVERTADDGIEVVGEGNGDEEGGSYGTGQTLIGNNTISDAGYDGSGGDAALGGGLIYYSGDTEYGADGIHVRGIFNGSHPDPQNGLPQYNIEIVGNTINGSDDDGIEIMISSEGQYYGDSTYILVDSNNVSDSGDNGILIVADGGYGGDEEGDDGEYMGYINSDIFNNTVENSGTHGLYISGFGHGDVVLAGNTFINNPVGARFESGNIDVSDIENPNSFIVTDDYELPEGFDFVTGMQFEMANADYPTSLTIVGETLGTTIFEGFINRDVGEAYYVRFEDGAMLDEDGNVIVIDGENVSWDGFVPLLNQDESGNIPAAILEAIEDRLYDADDTVINERGQIFVGTPIPDSLTLENIEDFFNQFGAFNGGATGLNITVTGLPFTGTPPGGPAPGAADLASIEPAAGEEEGEGTTTTTNPEDVEPAAGGENTTCWGDAIDAAGTGATASLNWGGSFEDSLAGASACNTGTI